MRVTPSTMIGRVSAVFGPLMQLANLIGLGLAGVLAGLVAWRTRNVALTLAVGLLALVAGVVVLSWSQTGHDWWWTLALALLGVGLLGGSALARNRYQNLGTSESLLIAALAPLAGAAALAVLRSGVGIRPGYRYPSIRRLARPDGLLPALGESRRTADAASA